MLSRSGPATEGCTWNRPCRIVFQRSAAESDWHTRCRASWAWDQVQIPKVGDDPATR